MKSSLPIAKSNPVVIDCDLNICVKAALQCVMLSSLHQSTPTQKKKAVWPYARLPPTTKLDIAIIVYYVLRNYQKVNKIGYTLPVYKNKLFYMSTEHKVPVSSVHQFHHTRLCAHSWVTHLQQFSSRTKTS